MGLLKLGSFYKKNKKKQEIVVAKEETRSPRLPTPVEQPIKDEEIISSGGLFDDIFAELNSVKEDKNDMALAIALSKQLEIKEDNSCNKQEKKEETVKTLKVLDSDVSDSDDDQQEDEQERTRDRMTKGIRPIMERRTNEHRIQRKVDSWNTKINPESGRVESSEAMIERMKDRHRNQVKLAALQRQQDMQNMMMMNIVPQSYLPHPSNNLMMDPMYTYSTPIPSQFTHINQQQQPQQPQYPKKQSKVSSLQTKTRQHSSDQNNSCGSNLSIRSSESSLFTKKEDCDGAEADVEISEDDEYHIKPKKNNTEQKMRPSKSTPNLKKKKKLISQENTLQSTDYPITPQNNNIRHMKSEPELINHMKRQQMQSQQHYLQLEWDRMQVFQREQQLKIMQQQQYMSMYPMMYYNQPIMMPTASNPRTSHSYAYNTR